MHSENRCIYVYMCVLEICILCCSYITQLQLQANDYRPRLGTGDARDDSLANETYPQTYEHHLEIQGVSSYKYVKFSRVCSPACIKNQYESLEIFCKQGEGNLPEYSTARFLSSVA